MACQHGCLTTSSVELRATYLLDCQNYKCHGKTYPSLRPYWASEAPPTSEFNRADRRLRCKGHARDVVEVPEHWAVPFRQALYNLDEFLLVLYGVDRRHYFAHALAFQMSRMVLVGNTEVVVSPTFRENLLDLLVVEDDGKRDCLQLFEEEGASAGGHVDMATASQHPPGHMEDGPHSAPERIDFVLPPLARFQPRRYSLERYWTQNVSRSEYD
jgi:hypothetical protein